MYVSIPVMVGAQGDFLCPVTLNLSHPLPGAPQRTPCHPDSQTINTIFPKMLLKPGPSDNIRGKTTGVRLLLHVSVLRTLGALYSTKTRPPEDLFWPLVSCIITL